MPGLRSGAMRGGAGYPTLSSVRRALTVLAAASVLAGCGELTVEDPRGTVTVKPGQEFVLDFPTNPSVGFDWRLDTRLGPGARSATSATGPSRRTRARDGGGVRKNFRFEGRRPGANVLRFTRLYREKPDRRRAVRVDRALVRTSSRSSRSIAVAVLEDVAVGVPAVLVSARVGLPLPAAVLLPGKARRVEAIAVQLDGQVVLGPAAVDVAAAARACW